MKCKTLITLSLVLVATVTFTATASAEGIKGKGKLEAWGDGIAGVHGQGTVSVTGRGILWLRDIAGDAEWTISGTGEKRIFKHGWVEYLGFDGEFEMTGSNIMVVLSGNNIHLTATGKGKAVLWGEGHYQIGSRTGEWRAQMQVLNLGEAN